MQAATDDTIDEENFRSGPIFISGVSGDSAAAVNGYYEPTLGIGIDGRVMYAKHGGGSVCIEHFGDFWQIKRVENRGENTCISSIAGGCALVDCVARVWSKASPNGPIEDIRMKLLTGDDAEQEVSGCCLHNETSLSMLVPALASSDMRPQFLMTSEGLARATEEARTTLILINGFTYEQGGLRMNGFYHPTKERRGGRRVFEKLNDGSMCMEYWQGKWRIKQFEDRGRAKDCFATCTNDLEYLDN